MAVAFQSAQTANNASTSVTVTKPTSTAEGDFLIGHFTTNANTRTITPPSGWTTIDEVDDGNYIRALYYKVAGGSEPANYSWSIDGASANITGAICRITGQGAMPTVLVSNTASVTNQSGTVVSTNTTITPFTTTSSIMMLFFSLKASSGTFTASSYAIATDDPGDWSERYDQGGIGGYTIAQYAASSTTRTELTATGASSADFQNSGNNKDVQGWAVFIGDTIDVAVTGTTGVINVVGNEGTVTGSANITGTTGVINVVGNEGTVATAGPRVTNKDKNIASTIVNKDKN